MQTQQMQQQIHDIFQASIAAKQQLLASTELVALTGEVSQRIADAFGQGKRLYLCGNGGSAADAQHLAAEFTGAFYQRQRPALPAEALHVNGSYLTAVANDYDYASVYSRLVEGIMQSGDVLIGLSTSGNSANVVKALQAARAKGVVTIGMTGQHGGQMRDLCDYLFAVPSTDTPRIQECHMLIGHTICQLVEQIIFPKA